MGGDAPIVGPGSIDMISGTGSPADKREIISLVRLAVAISLSMLMIASTLSPSVVEARPFTNASLGAEQGPDVEFLLKSLRTETDPQKVDAVAARLRKLGVTPPDRKACLEAAGRSWDIADGKFLFDCWRAQATRNELIAHAVSGALVVRALALEALAESSGLSQKPPIPLTMTPPPPIPRGRDSGVQAKVSLLSQQRVEARPAPSAGATQGLDEPTRRKLMQSAVEILSQNITTRPEPGSISFSTAQAARQALWDLSGHDMGVALEFADRIEPAFGHYDTTGRFGESYDLAARDHAGYVARRRPRQVLAAILALLLMCPLLAVGRLRRAGAPIAASLVLWALWCAFQSDFRELPSPPLYYLTVSGLAFISAGAATAWMRAMRIRPWLKVLGAPILSGIGAFFVCGLTRAVGLFPIGTEGWELLFDPLYSAILAVPVALILAILMACWKPAHATSRSTRV